ncbi:Receptor ligand binding region [Trinorchestia longiramus]|nr:Receptor ligand binding region [Trinorchestia longiramus]
MTPPSGYITQSRPRGKTVDALLDAALRNVSTEGVPLLPLHREVPRNDPSAAAAAVCSLADEGVAAIVDGGHNPLLCGGYGVPCLSIRTSAAKPGPEQEALIVRMEPEKNIIAEATAGLLRDMRWFTFSLVYDNMDHLVLLEPVLSDSAFRITLVKIQTKHSYMEVAEALDKTRGSRVVLALEPSHLRGLLRTCSAVVRRPLQVLVATPHTRLEDLQAASTKLPLMGVRLGGSISASSPVLPNVDMEEALVLDAVMTVHRALQEWPKHQASPLRTQSGLCSHRQKWDQGRDFFQSLSQVNFEGHSGPVSFNAEGFRSDFSLSIIHFSKDTTSEVMR